MIIKIINKLKIKNITKKIKIKNKLSMKSKILKIKVSKFRKIIFKNLHLLKIYKTKIKRL